MCSSDLVISGGEPARPGVAIPRPGKAGHGMQILKSYPDVHYLPLLVLIALVRGLPNDKTCQSLIHTSPKTTHCGAPSSTLGMDSGSKAILEAYCCAPCSGRTRNMVSRLTAMAAKERNIAIS